VVPDIFVAASYIIAGVVAGYFGRFFLVKRDAEVRAAYLGGKQDGIREESGRLEILITPFHYKESSWLGMKNVLTVGYQQQIVYRRLPIGEPQRVPIHYEETWDNNRVNQILQLATTAANAYAATLNAAGINASLGQ